MVTDGILISVHELCARLQMNREHFQKLVEDGSVFSMTVDGSTYYPALFADPLVNQRRLRAICRIITPAPPDARLDFLSSRYGSLGDRRPIDLLNDDGDYARLRENAAAWVAQWSRTTVTLYEGQFETKPHNVEPLYTAMAEIDPRRSLLDRASTVLAAREYEFPLGPYPEARTFTAFVDRQDADDPEARPDACVQIVVDGELIRIRAIYKEGMARLSQAVTDGKPVSVVDAIKKAIANLLEALS